MNKLSGDDVSVLQLMDACLKAGPDIYKASKMWASLNQSFIDDLDMHGFENFKRTINPSFFNFMVMRPNDEQLKVLLKWWRKNFGIGPLFSTFLDDGLDFGLTRKKKALHFFRTYRRRFFYKLFVTLLWEYTNKMDRYSLLQQMSEPEVGNPYRIHHRGKLISQDLCNSILEYNIIRKFYEEDKIKVSRIAELGGGYGRVGYIFLKTGGVQYIDFDVPPSLFIAQKYIRTCFPEKRIFRFRNFSNFNEIKKEMESADAAFFTPNQMELFPEKFFDVFVNISSLHEMTQKQIDHYFKIIDKQTKNLFYTKQWIESTNTYDGIVIKENDYPVPNNWVNMYRSKHFIQNKFFEAIFRIT